MWANAQCDGRPAKYRWRPLFNAAKFGWRRLLECRGVTLSRRESRWNLQGCPKLANRPQPLVGRISGHVEQVLLFNKFFPIVDTCISSEDIARQTCAMVSKWRFLRPVFPASRVQHTSDLQSKFAPCVEVWYTSNLRPLRLGEEKRRRIRRKKQTTGQKYNGLPYYIGRP